MFGFKRKDEKMDDEREETYSAFERTTIDLHKQLREKKSALETLLDEIASKREQHHH